MAAGEGEGKGTMDKIEKILTFGNTAAIIGITFYFYRSNTALQSQMVKLSDALRHLIQTVGVMEEKMNRMEQLANGLKKLDIEVRNLSSDIDQTATKEEFDEFVDMLYNMEEVLKENGIDVPPPQQQTRRRSSMKRQPKVVSFNSSSRRRNERNKSSRSPNRGRHEDKTDEDEGDGEIDPNAVMEEMRRNQGSRRR